MRLSKPSFFSRGCKVWNTERNCFMPCSTISISIFWVKNLIIFIWKVIFLWLCRLVKWQVIVYVVWIQSTNARKNRIPKITFSTYSSVGPLLAGFNKGRRMKRTHHSMKLTARDILPTHPLSLFIFHLLWRHCSFDLRARLHLAKTFIPYQQLRYYVIESGFESLKLRYSIWLRSITYILWNRNDKVLWNINHAAVYLIRCFYPIKCISFQWFKERLRTLITEIVRFRKLHKAFHAIIHQSTGN